MENKKVGIVCEFFKQTMFETKLKEKWFTDYEISKQGNLQVIKVNVDETQVEEVHKICQLVQLHFNRGN